MSEIQLEDRQGRELRFAGELIGECEEAIELADGVARKFRVRTYSIAGGGFVPLLEYETADPEERALTCFEDVDGVDDIEKFYYVFEPSEILPEVSQLSHYEAEVRSARRRQLSKKYESMIFKYLDELHKQVAQHDYPERRVRPGEGSSGKSLWSLLRIR